MELSKDQTYDRPQLIHQIQTGCSMQLQVKLSDNIHELTMQQLQQNIIERQRRIALSLGLTLPLTDSNLAPKAAAVAHQDLNNEANDQCVAHETQASASNPVANEAPSRRAPYWSHIFARASSAPTSSRVSSAPTSARVSSAPTSAHVSSAPFFASRVSARAPYWSHRVSRTLLNKKFHSRNL